MDWLSCLTRALGRWAARPSPDQVRSHGPGSDSTGGGQQSSTIFYLARFADQPDACVRDSPGVLPFMALDLLSREGLRGGGGGPSPLSTRRRVIYMGSDMPVATVANEDSKNVIKNPHPLRRRFTDREGSRNAKVGLDWRYFSDNHDIPLVHSNTKTLARVLHEYWVDQYTRRIAKPKETKISGKVTMFSESLSLSYRSRSGSCRMKNPKTKIYSGSYWLFRTGCWVVWR